MLHTFVHSPEDFERATEQSNIGFLHAENGILRYNHQPGIWTVIQKIHSTKDAKIPGLLPIDAGCVVHVKPMSVPFVKKVLGFLFYAMEKFGEAEAMVYLYYNVSHGTWQAIPPKQQISSASVDYGEQPAAPNGYRLIGTLHSHPTFKAYQSGTDNKDQIDFDGIHITLGELHKYRFDIDMSIYVGGTRYKMEKPEQFIPNPNKPNYRFPESWKELLNEAPPVTVVKGKSGGNGYKTRRNPNLINSGSIFTEYLKENWRTTNIRDLVDYVSEWIEAVQASFQFQRRDKYTLIMGAPFDVELQFSPNSGIHLLRLIEDPSKAMPQRNLRLVRDDRHRNATLFFRSNPEINAKSNFVTAIDIVEVINDKLDQSQTLGYGASKTYWTTGNLEAELYETDGQDFTNYSG